MRVIFRQKNIALLVLFLLLPLKAYASGKIWVAATGEAYMSEMDTPKEVMDRAEKDAGDKAVKEAEGEFVRSNTLVSNNQLAEDLVYASARGKIEKIEIIKKGWDKDDRNLYRVRLKALVAPLKKEQGISVKLALSKSVLKEGDDVKLSYEADRDCYIYVFSVAADGSVTLLLPNSAEQDNKIDADQAYEFPGKDSPIKHLKAMFLPDYRGNSARESITVIATVNKEDIIALGFQEGFKVYDASSTGMKSDLVKRLNQLDLADWAWATADYTIER